MRSSNSARGEFLRVLRDDKINLKKLKDLAERPPLFHCGDQDIWTDEHISKEMLAAHLDPDFNAASRKHETIIRSCDWIVSRLDLKEGSKVIDLGCGPGLYCKEFARFGLDVTGVDYSKGSIVHARSHTNDSIRYIHGNYLTVDLGDGYDAAFMIYYDFDVLSDKDRADMLDRVHSILKDRGYFVLDVLTPDHDDAGQETMEWSVNPKGGFWSSKGYLELFQRYYYPQEQVKLDQSIIIEEDGNTKTYRIWHRLFTLSEITKLLKNHGFTVEDFYTDLVGTFYEPRSTSIGLIARKD